MSVVLCSRNAHKARELEGLLPGWSIATLDADDYPPENGDTYYENALLKARFGHERAGGWTLGDDSGIEVAALGGAPGVVTARWAEGRHVEKALAALDGVDDRRAQYVCELVAIAPDGDEVVGTGVLRGEIALSAAGSEGFGFDPVFVPLGEARTVAELGDAWKAEHSHRALAAHALRDAISQRR